MKKMLFGDKIFIHINGNKADVRIGNIQEARGYKNDSKVYLNGYIAIYMPEHKRSFDNGCVYEHILVAEKILGRELNDGECVHHIDKNRTNNEDSNLMVFKTNEDHICYHAGGEIIQNDDGTYSAQRKYNIESLYINRTRNEIDKGIKDQGSIKIVGKNICPYCKSNLKSIRAKMCIECHMKKTRENIPTKAELEKYIYNLPFTQIGEMYGVSDNAVRKWCKYYGLPYRRKDIKSINR